MSKQPLESSVFQLLSHVADLMLVSILWTVCSIPIFTAGAATTAMYTVTMKLIGGEETPVAGTFFRAFRDNFKTATLTWLILLAITVPVAASVAAVLGNAPGDVPVVRIICLVAAGLFWLAGNYVYPLTAYFDNKISRTLLNSVLMVFGDLPRALLIGCCSIVPFAVYMIDPGFFMSTAIFWVIAGVGILADLQSRVFRKVFSRYLPPEEASPGEEDLHIE